MSIIAMASDLRKANMSVMGVEWIIIDVLLEEYISSFDGGIKCRSQDLRRT